MKIKILQLVVIVTMIVIAGCSSLTPAPTQASIMKGCYAEEKVPDFPVKVWNSEKIFGTVNDIKGSYKFGDCDEAKYLKFYSNKNIKGIGNNSSYWRWHYTVSADEFEKMINNNLYALSKRGGAIFKLSGGEWSKASIDKNSVGDLKSISVVRRGSSGIAIDVLVKGSKGTFIVRKDWNVRTLLGFSKEARESTKNVALIGKTDNVISNNQTTAPSAFLSVEKKGSKYVVYGGGFGHGVGMPQNSASDLAKNYGYTYKKILGKYYGNSQLTSASDVKNFNGEIKVGITNNGSVVHQKITIKGDKSIKLVGDDDSYTLKVGKTVSFVKKGNVTVATVDDKEVLTSKEPIKVSSKEMIKVTSINRNVGKDKPSYRGSFMIKNSESGLLLINIVDLEDYLKQVVGSEMPGNYPLEALKAQAVAARTYAMNGFLDVKYNRLGFDVDDTTASQVYNYQEESAVVNKAVEATKDKILTYNGRPIVAYFYSTSSGRSSTPMEVW